MVLKRYAEGRVYRAFRERKVFVRGSKGDKEKGEEGERNVSRVCHIPALCRILCLFTPFTSRNEVRGDERCGLLSSLR